MNVSSLSSRRPALSRDRRLRTLFAPFGTHPKTRPPSLMPAVFKQTQRVIRRLEADWHETVERYGADSPLAASIREDIARTAEEGARRLRLLGLIERVSSHAY